jgi:hypothetical protein
VYEGLILERMVTGLLPYTAYDFQVLSYNSAGEVENAGWTRAETLQTSVYSPAVLIYCYV